MLLVVVAHDVYAAVKCVASEVFDVDFASITSDKGLEFTLIEH